MGIFLSRWLVTPLGPWLNLTSGIAGYSWPRFLFWDVTGEVLWVVIYVNLGKIFSDRVSALAELLGNLTWVIVGVHRGCHPGVETASVFSQRLNVLTVIRFALSGGSCFSIFAAAVGHQRK
jgi:hypothetical protein